MKLSTWEVDNHGQSWELINDGPYLFHYNIADEKSIWIWVTDAQVAEYITYDSHPFIRYLEGGKPAMELVNFGELEGVLEEADLYRMYVRGQEVARMLGLM